jgi:hypothetical protein
MKEDFLQFIWLNQYFYKDNLRTTTGEELSIFNQGTKNSNSGPDFNGSRIRINDITWVGNTEIHRQSSDWNTHKHGQDKAYDNVILHVVWEDDKPVKRTDLTSIPTLELKNRIDPSVISRYNTLIRNETKILCASSFHTVSTLSKNSMLDRAVLNRLENKANVVREMLYSCANNWEQVAYSMLASNFGFKLNHFPFLRLSQSLPLKLLIKHSDHLFKMEALLFGVAGFFHYPYNDKYPNELRKEYAFLSHKYNLHRNELSIAEWKFSKVRPANFPTLRLAQFAAFIRHDPKLFSLFLHTSDIGNLLKEQYKVSDYWQEHYSFDKHAPVHSTNLGKESIYNIAINTIVPLLVAYSKEKDEPEYMEKAISLLESIPAERNRITREWLNLDHPMQNAFDTQGAIELYNNYCTKRACLNCIIGKEIINK